MHKQAAQKRPELLQVLAVVLMHRVVVGLVMIFLIQLLAGSNLVIYRVETDTHTDQNRRHGQRIEKC